MPQVVPTPAIDKPMETDMYDFGNNPFIADPPSPRGPEITILDYDDLPTKELLYLLDFKINKYTKLIELYSTGTEEADLLQEMCIRRLDLYSGMKEEVLFN